MGQGERGRLSAPTRRTTLKALGSGSIGAIGYAGRGRGVQQSRTLTITKRGTPDGVARYEVTVTGDIVDTEDFEAGGTDEVSGSTATGRVGPERGTDTIRFTGEIDSIRVDGPATVLLDGDEIDPSRIDANGPTEELPLDRQLSDADTQIEDYGPTWAIEEELYEHAAVQAAQRTGTIDLYTAVEGSIGPVGGGGYGVGGRLRFSTAWEAPRDGTVTVSSAYTYDGGVRQSRDSNQFQNAVSRVGVQARSVVRELTTGELVAESDPVVAWDVVIPRLDELAEEGLDSVFEAIMDELIPVVGGFIGEQLTERPDVDIHTPGNPDQPRSISGDDSVSVSFPASRGRSYELQLLFEGITLAASIGGTPAEAELEFDPVVGEMTVSESGDRGGDGGRPATFAVADMRTNSPIGGGEVLEVEATIRNVGDETGTTDVELVVGHTPAVEDSEMLTLEPGESRTLTLTFRAGQPSGEVEEFPVVVDTGADSATRTVAVRSDATTGDGSGSTPATFNVMDISTNSPVGGGEVLEVEATIRNVGDETGTTDVELIVGHTPAVEDREMLTLEPGESRTLTLTFRAGQPSGAVEEFPVVVDTGADAASETVAVES